MTEDNADAWPLSHRGAEAARRVQDLPEFRRHERRAQGGFADMISVHYSSVNSQGYASEWTLCFVSSVFPCLLGTALQPVGSYTVWNRATKQVELKSGEILRNFFFIVDERAVT